MISPKRVGWVNLSLARVTVTSGEQTGLVNLAAAKRRD
jgi:hypothetical protein